MMLTPLEMQGCRDTGEAIMAGDLCTVHRNAENPEWNDQGVLLTPPDLVYDGPCLIEAMRWEGSDVLYGAKPVRLRIVEFRVPHDADVRYGDVLEFYETKFDESLPGVPFRVTDVTRNALVVTRFCIGQEITPGEEPS